MKIVSANTKHVQLVIVEFDDGSMQPAIRVEPGEWVVGVNAGLFVSPDNVKELEQEFAEFTKTQVTLQ